MIKNLLAETRQIEKMDVLLLTKMLLVLSVVKAKQSINCPNGQQNCTKKEIIVVNSPKTRHHAGTKVFRKLVVCYLYRCSTTNFYCCVELCFC